MTSVGGFDQISIRSSIDEAVEYETRKRDSDDSSLTEEVEEESIFDVKINVDNLGYLALIRKNRQLFANRNFDLKPKWDKLKIKSMNHDQMSMYVHARIISSLFLTTQQCIRMIGCLRSISKGDRSVFKNILCMDDVDEIYRTLFYKQVNDEYITSIIGSKLSQRLYNTSILLSNNKRLDHYANVLVKQGNIKTTFKKLSEQLSGLYNAMEVRMLMTADEVNDKNTSLITSFVDYKNKRFTMDVLRAKIREAIILNTIRIKQKDDMITSTLYKYRKLKDNRDEVMSTITIMSTRAMGLNYDMMKLSIDALRVKAAEATASYETLLAEHLKVETGLRASRYKLETKLATCVAKYDTAMLERQVEIDKITDLKESEFEELMELQCLYNEQKRTFIKYRKMYDKEEEELQLKIIAFRMERAAKVIQRAWRKYRRRTRSKKKKRKGRAKSPATGKKAGAKPGAKPGPKLVAKPGKAKKKV